MNPYVSLSDLTLAVTVLLTISAVMITVARRLGLGPQLGLLLSGVIPGLSQVMSLPQVEGMRRARNSEWSFSSS